MLNSKTYEDLSSFLYALYGKHASPVVSYHGDTVLYLSRDVTSKYYVIKSFSL